MPDDKEIIWSGGRRWRVIRREIVQWQYELGSKQAGTGPRYTAVTVEPIDEQENERERRNR